MDYRLLISVSLLLVKIQIGVNMTSPYASYQYNKAITPMIKSIGEPLLRTFGITNFGIIKVNDQRLML